MPGLQQLRRVLVVEARPLLSVLALFLLVLFLGSVAIYVLERDEQPATFGNIPSALWWAVVTLTTTGYGDVVPVTPLGRLVAAMVMISGPRRVRAVDRYSRHRICRRNAARQLS